MQIFVGSSSGNARPAYSCETFVEHLKNVLYIKKDYETDSNINNIITGFSNTDLFEQIRIEYNLINKSIDSYTKVENNDINVYKDLNPDNYSYEILNFIDSQPIIFEI